MYLQSHPNVRGEYCRNARLPIPALAACCGAITMCMAANAAASTLLNVNPTTLSFASVPDIRTRTATVTLTNAGTTSVTVSSIALSGAGFKLSTLSMPLTLAVGQSTSFTLTFAPPSASAFAGTITIASNATNSPAQVALAGTGVLPQLSVYAIGIFGSVPVGSRSTHTVTVTNLSTTPMTVTQVPLTGNGFSTSGLSLPLTLAAGANSTFSLIFAPTAAATYNGSMPVISTANDSPSVFTLSGTGIASTGGTPAVRLSASSVAFGNQAVDMTSSGHAVTLSNSGGGALSISKVAITGTNASDFSEASACGGSLAAGGNCTISVMFTPAVAGGRTGALSITDNATGTPQSVSLSGTGLHDVILSWNSSAGSGIAGYNVYRGTSSGMEASTPLNSSPVSGPTYADTGVTSGTKYYYVLRTVASGGTLSAASGEVAATVP